MKMVNGQYITGAYNMNLVMDIDLTGSMSPILNTVKTFAQQLVDMIAERMEDAGKSIDRTMIQIIGFRDYKYDGDNTIVESPVFELPQDNEAFQAFLNGLEATGGGDAPESAFEALALACKAHQNMMRPDVDRCVTIMLTDNAPHELNDPQRTKNPLYPEDMPKDIAELVACLCGTNQTPYTVPDSRKSRLVIFAPEAGQWSSLDSVSNTWRETTELGAGLKDTSAFAIADLVANSVAK